MFVYMWEMQDSNDIKDKRKELGSGIVLFANELGLVVNVYGKL